MTILKDKLLLMSNGELREFLRDARNHTTEETDAALAEAKNRGLEVGKQAFEVQPIESPPIFPKVVPDPNNQWGTAQQVTDESAPLLYSKRAIYTFAFLFSVLFGAVLIVLNLRSLKKPEGVVPTISFSIAYLVTVTLILGFLESHLKATFSSGYLVSSLGAWLILKLVWDKYIGKDTNYRKRSVFAPAAIGILIVVAYFLLHVQVAAKG